MSTTTAKVSLSTTVLFLLCTFGVFPARAAGSPPSPSPVIVVDRDDVEIKESCTVHVEAGAIVDANDDGVVHITADGVTVDFDGSSLRGAREDRAPNTLAGIGIRITGENVTLRGAVVGGFKIGIYATRAHGLLIENCDISENFRQRLRSTPQAADSADGLRPHVNDHHEWLSSYGAGICVERSNQVIVRRVRVRSGQNGIVLDRVNRSEIYDNDCSFLSGWGLALWRSNRNTISGNAFDFCVRGYSHGVYNRSHDSAGILMIEQCSENVVTQNSATHCGNGLFAFAGKVALGEIESQDEPGWYHERGSNRNLIVRNDFSDAVAHGLNVTFGFDNKIVDNRLVGNAVCGIWGSHSQNTVIAFNKLRDNGGMPYGSRRGGINIDNGYNNHIAQNAFEQNACGVFLWADEEEPLIRLPWYLVNARDRRSELNSVRNNTFRGEEIGIRLRRSTSNVVADNEFSEVAVHVDADEQSRKSLIAEHPSEIAHSRHENVTGPGNERPVGGRAHLSGREHIIMTEWGPYDWQGPLPVVWRVRFFASRIDPRRDADGWRAESDAAGVVCSLPALDLRFADRGPGELDLAGVLADESLPDDHFGTIAESTIWLPVGRHRIRTTSDDGIRVWLDSRLVVDDWTRHRSRSHEYEFEVSKPMAVTVRVEHFEHDGDAVLALQIEPLR
jgi:parallel beta-helix repeat protein